MTQKIFDCVILGAGPAGMNAALYCARANLDCALVDISAIGGAPMNYLEIENYLGFNKINTFDLCEKFEQHIDNFNIQKYPYCEIEKIDLTKDIKKIKTTEKEFLAKSIIIATGASPKKLDIKGEEEARGKGVSYCAICDGNFYKDKIVCVVGGGNSALEEAIYLSNIAKKVYLIHRRNEFRADKILQERIKQIKNVEFVLNAQCKEILLDNKVYGLKIEQNGIEKIIETDGIFPYIGLSANIDYFHSQLELTPDGFILTDENMKTNLDGVYAIGDIRNTPLRQVITAVSDGAIAGVNVSKYVLNSEKIEIKK